MKMKQLSNRLQDLRKAKGLTTAELAKKLALPKVQSGPMKVKRNKCL